MHAAILNANRPPAVFGDDTYARLNTNSGNYYIAYAMAKMLGLGAESVVNDTVWRPFPEDAGLSERVAGAGAIILPLQDQLRTSFPDEEYENALALLKGLERGGAPMVAVSLGANSFEGYDPALWSKLSPTRVRFFRYLSDRCVSIGVRGPFSADVLSAIGVRNVEVVGCPSYFETGPDRQVAPAAPSNGARIAATGLFRTRLSRPLTVLQGDGDWPLVQLLHKPEGPLAPDQTQAIAASAAYRMLLDDVRRDRVWFASDPEAWKRRLRETCVLAVGTRLHGAIAALNAGIPAIVTNGDARARESCAYFGIPWLPGGCGHDTSLETLCELAEVETLNAAYAARRAQFADWMADVGLPLAPIGPSRLPPCEMARAPAAIVLERVDAARSRWIEIETERAQAAEIRAASAEQLQRAAEQRLSEAEQGLIDLRVEAAASTVGLAAALALAARLQTELTELGFRLAASIARSDDLDQGLAAERAERLRQADASANSLRQLRSGIEEARAELDGLKRHWAVRLIQARAPLTPIGTRRS